MYSTKLLPVVVFGVAGFARVTGMAEHGAAAALFYVSAYMFTQTFIMILKVIVARVRPGTALAKELRGRRRHLECLNYRDKKGMTVIQAFPSGDVAGAMVFSVALFIIDGTSLSSKTFFF